MGGDGDVVDPFKRCTKAARTWESSCGTSTYPQGRGDASRWAWRMGRVQVHRDMRVCTVLRCLIQAMQSTAMTRCSFRTRCVWVSNRARWRIGCTQALFMKASFLACHMRASPLLGSDHTHGRTLMHGCVQNTCSRRREVASGWYTSVRPTAIDGSKPCPPRYGRPQTLVCARVKRYFPMAAGRIWLVPATAWSHSGRCVASSSSMLRADEWLLRCHVALVASLVGQMTPPAIERACYVCLIDNP